MSAHKDNLWAKVPSLLMRQKAAQLGISTAYAALVPNLIKRLSISGLSKTSPE